MSLMHFGRKLNIFENGSSPEAILPYYDPRYYAAKVLDPDGYSLEFVYKSWQHPQKEVVRSFEFPQA